MYASTAFHRSNKTKAKNTEQSTLIPRGAKIENFLTRNECTSEKDEKKRRRRRRRQQQQQELTCAVLRVVFNIRLLHVSLYFFLLVLHTSCVAYIPFVSCQLYDACPVLFILYRSGHGADGFVPPSPPPPHSAYAKLSRRVEKGTDQTNGWMDISTGRPET